ncbi:MAG TPA: response regulator [Gemmatimonadaceae bacterium]|nr:response regulator [Gemmatimonadaceae bacterium]
MTAPQGAAAPIAGARKLLVVMSDLLFRSKIDEVARRLGLELRVAKSPEQLDRQLAAGEPGLAIVDLEESALDPFAAIARIHSTSPGTPILGFAGHGNVEAIRRGREGGATVLARSGFTAQLPALLTQVADRERARAPK